MSRKLRERTSSDPVDHTQCKSACSVRVTSKNASNHQAALYHLILRKTATETFDMIREIYKNVTMSRIRVFEWYEHSKIAGKTWQCRLNHSTLLI